MSAQQIPRRLVQPAASTSISFPTLPIRPARHCQQRRHASSWFGFGGNRSSAPTASDASRGKVSNPLLQDYLEKKPSLQQNMRLPAKGDLTKSSIFEQEEEARRRDDKIKKEAGEAIEKGAPTERNLDAMSAALDPEPMQRKKWEARMIAREIRRRGRMSKTEVIKQTERSHTNTSPLMKTSVKKLGMLARQIAGKSLEDAMLQMRFSSKKAAKDVLTHLQYAKDSAVVRNGMGLGRANGELDGHAPTTIRDKEGNRVKVRDRSSMYVDEAWVNRGPYGQKPEFRARGRTNVLRLPYTSLTVVLKEEATRVRLHQEREAKEAKRKVWVAMPDRPVTGQHQYPLW